MGPKQKRNMVLVNAITSVRIIGALIMVPIYLLCGRLISSIVAALIFLTDALDGYLARKLNSQSFFGSIMDGFADKLFGIVILIILSTKNMIFLLPIVFEIVIFIITIESLKRGNNVKSSIMGKCKTWALDILLVSCLVIEYVEYFIDAIKYAIMPLVIILQIIVIIDYYKKMINGKPVVNNEKKKLKSKDQILGNLFDTEYYLKHRDDGIKSLLYSSK